MFASINSLGMFSQYRKQGSIPFSLLQLLNTDVFRHGCQFYLQLTNTQIQCLMGPKHSWKAYDLAKLAEDKEVWTVLG